MERKEMPTGRGIARGNKLKNATSPYLLQHADNPVDWYQWGEDAFEKARKENKPIFLSIGYSTCHWCHVMAHESFEDAKTADLLNKYFVSIKVDREERPDIDSVYMAVCQSFTGSGGWPMSIFMTWDKKPFFAGTYFPLHSRYGMPSFTDVLSAIEEKWSDKSEGHDEIIQAADEIIAHLNKDEESSKEVAYKDNAIERAALIFKHIFDSKHGGFGPAPKFPTPHNLMFLIMCAELNKDAMALKMAETTLIKMRKGGIFDHIGYGFSRYSTDKYFLAPHFEKMLYDNALLIMAYSAAYSATKRDVYLDTAKKTAEYVLREMRSPEGGFYSAQDADSEGVEGKFYTFTLEEVMSVLGEEKGKELARVYDVTEKGNFEGANILNLLKSNDLEADYDKELQMLYEYRKKRTSLHLDDKQLCSWNSLMIAAFAMLYRVARDGKYLEAAEKAKAFIDKKLRKDKELFISYREGKCTGHGLIYDYAFYVAALLELYSSTLNKEYLCQAEEFCDEAVKGFGDASNGAVNGYYLCRTDIKELFMNPKEIYDGAIPSGNSVMAYNLVRLYQLTEKDKYARLAESQIKWMSAKIGDYPAGYTMYLLARLIYENPPKHVIVVLKDASELSEIKKTLPLLANILVTEESKEYPIINDKTTYYVCKGHTCFPPTNTINF